MIEVVGLTKYYGRLPAIEDVNFRIESGEIVGFLGPNGAGKTTTMRILTCFSPASSGDARIMGMDVRDKSFEIRKKLGYLPENVPLYSWMRVKGYLRFVAQAKGVPRSRRIAEIDRVAQATGVTQVMGQLIRTLSKGYRQRVGLAQALIGNPDILVLDEPTIGLDPKQIREIRELIKGFAKDRTVILSTHILSEVSQVCSRVIIINKGKIVAEDSPANLRKRNQEAARCSITVRAPRDAARSLIGAVPGVTSVEDSDSEDEAGAQFLIKAQPGAEIGPVLAKAVVDKGWDLVELTPVHASLEDVFIDLVTGGTSTAGSANVNGEKESDQ